LKSDTVLAQNIDQAAKKRNLSTRLTSYHGFPVDTGTVVVQTLLNWDQRFKSVVMSSNIYADRAETVVLGKAVREGIIQSKRKVAAIVISSLSNRLHSEWINSQEDHIRSLKDQEWNQKFLEFLSEGRLEDISQLSRQFHREARIHKVSNYKPFWWLSAVMGQNNLYRGEVFEYQPVFGTGAAVVSLTPSDQAARDLEFDENDPEFFLGERNVLETSIESRTQMDSHFHFERGEHVDN
jgi:2-aminophenol/2-amino-5-chlorophenol 1,6-dioxygenase subunit alpha